MPYPRKAVAAALLATLIAGIAPAAMAENVAAEARAAQRDVAFTGWLKSLLARVQADPKYRRLPLDTDAQTEEFEARLHEAYRGLITSAEFTTWADSRYPGHQYELGVISGALPK